MTQLFLALMVVLSHSWWNSSNPDEVGIKKFHNGHQGCTKFTKYKWELQFLINAKNSLFERSKGTRSEYPPCATAALRRTRSAGSLCSSFARGKATANRFCTTEFFFIFHCDPCVSLVLFVELSSSSPTACAEAITVAQGEPSRRTT